MDVCVFCSSADASLAGHGGLARDVGTGLVARGHGLVYGGTRVGMMGVLARTVRDAGGHVVGVLPKLLVERGIADHDCDELLVTDGMADRKTAMIQRADAFLAVPGGLGTLDELLEVVTLKQLGYHGLPVAVYGPGGFWQPLADLFARLHEDGMALPPDDLLLFTDDLDRAFGHLEAGGTQPDEVWRA